MFCMSTWKPSFYNVVVDNVGGHPIFHAILANASISDAVEGLGTCSMIAGNVSNLAIYS
jgi:hypothetical protein